MISSQLDIVSDWNNHAFNVHANATIGRDADRTEGDVDDFSVDADGQLDITQWVDLRAAVSYDRLHEWGVSPDDVEEKAVRRPSSSQYSMSVLHFSPTDNNGSGHLLLEFNGAADQLDYGNGARGRRNDDRDRAIIAGGLKLGAWKNSN